MVKKKRKDKFCEYYGLKQDDHKVRCPICDEPINFMMEHIEKSPIDHRYYHANCLLDEYWKMKGYE